ncbi:carbohydrate ABC transporter permease [Microbacterium sulfonylureivorans]|uniref:carbohydrate ABC transporter permease n=1 Tax=Microbacterium sulfonylureivorans TaxID=2486854 RepID=UPI001F0C12B1|nr:sugar ABC transporter permease [Microbacterium sulfonylureivorans]
MSTPSRAVVVWRRRLPGLVMASPAVIVFLAMFMVPMVLAFVLSLTNWNGFSLRFEFVGFENYLNAFKNPRVFNASTYTFVVALIGTLLCNAVGLALATLISGSGPLNTVARTVFFYPYIISALIIGFLWSALLAPQGVVNNVLVQLGLAPIPFLSDPELAKATVIFTVVWAAFGFNMILYIAGLKSIPAEYYEAAMMDGARKWMQFRHITLPLLAPVVTVNLVLTIVGLLKVYDIVLALTDGGPAGSTQTIVYQILKESFANAKLGFGSAQSVILLIVTAVIALTVTLARRGAEKKVSE